MKTRTNFVVIAIALLSLIALVGSAQACNANLTVTKNHPGYVFSDLTNVMTAYVENTGTGTTGSTFSVCINVTSDATGASLYTYKTIGVGPLAAGASEEVNLGNWMPGKVENITINVTADCDGDVTETDETDNSRIEVRNSTGNCSDDVIPKYEKIFEKECFGYQGQHPLTEAYVGGSDVIYTVGDYKYKNVTVNFEIGAPAGDVNRVDNLTADIPDGATIEQATLYKYYCWRRLDTYGYPDFGMQFTNSTGTYNVTEAANYTDYKGFGTSYMRERAYGTVVYDVTDYVTGNGTYTANATQDIWPRESSSYGYASGMALMVVYDDGSGCKRYRIAHGHDRLATYYQYSATSTSSYNVLPEDATMSTTLTDVNPSGGVTDANLFTATVDAVDYDTGVPTGESLHNGCNWFEGAWSNEVPMSDYNYPIGFNRSNVKNCLSSAGSDETVQFQERDTSTNKNGYSAVLAVLVAEKDPIESYGNSVDFQQNVFLAWRALDEPNNRGALMRRNAKIAIELEETIQECTNVSVWVRKVALRSPSFTVSVSSNGVDWTEIGSETCTSWWPWTRYDFTGDWDDVKYIGITKPGTPLKPKLMGLDAVRAEGCN